MPDNPTPEELAAWRELCEKATETLQSGIDNSSKSWRFGKKEMQLMYAARTALPRLIDAFEAEQAKVKAMRTALTSIQGHAADALTRAYAGIALKESE